MLMKFLLNKLICDYIRLATNNTQHPSDAPKLALFFFNSWCSTIFVSHMVDAPGHDILSTSNSANIPSICTRIFLLFERFKGGFFTL